VTGLPPSDDTYIDAGKPDAINGAQNTFEVRPDNGADRRGLVRFDLSSIPGNAIITSANLYLYERSNKTGQITYIYRVQTGWSETSATWNTPWLTPGGDFDNTVAYNNFIPDQKNCLASLDITNLVQAWVNGTYANYGVLLYSTGPNHIISYTSKEDNNVQEHPRLGVSYTLPAMAMRLQAPRNNTITKVTATVVPTPTASPGLTSTLTQTPTGTPTPTPSATVPMQQPPTTIPAVSNTPTQTRTATLTATVNHTVPPASTETPTQVH